MTKNTNEQLIQDNYRNVYALAHSLAKSYNLAFEAFEDLQKVGYISLIEQSKTFDENSGVPFWTYACKGVKLKMLEELRFILDTVSISPYLNKQIGKVRKIVSANAESNTSELIEIVSQILKISADKSEELLILSTKEKTSIDEYQSMLESGEGMQDDKLEDKLRSDCLNPEDLMLEQENQAFAMLLADSLDDILSHGKRNISECILASGALRRPLNKLGRSSALTPARWKRALSRL